MEVEMLIDAVRSRRPIWDPSLKLHSNRDHIKRLWDEIANELSIECGDAKKKWRSLRENYRKERGKERRTAAAGDNWKSTWVHYDELSFLKDLFVPRVASGSMGPGRTLSEFPEDFTQSPENQVTTNDEPRDTTGMCEIEMTGNEKLMEPSAPAPAPILAVAGNKKKPKTIANQEGFSSPATSKRFKKKKIAQHNNIGRKKSEEYLQRTPPSQAITHNHEVQDADYHFLMSLLPSLRAVPVQRKLFLRREIEGLFLQEQGYINETNMYGYSFDTPQRPSTAGSYETVLSPGWQSDEHSIGDRTNAEPHEDQTPQ